jgi:hypothetical protein
MLLDKDASKSGIMRALAVMRAGMTARGGNDLAVVHFSGHGAMVDHKLYLLPNEVDAHDDAGIKASGPTTSEESCWNLPDTGACWCCWMPAILERRR